MGDVQFADVNGTRTRYVTAGDGPAMVLVHGGHYGNRSSADDWALNLPALSKRFRVFAIDKLGMGHTDNPIARADYTIHSQAEHLEAFIRELDLGPAHLVGHSRGGYAVARVALDHSDLVNTLTVVSSSSITNPFNPVYGEWRRQAAAIEDEYEAVRFLIRANSFSEAHITDAMVEAGVEIGRLDKTREAQALMDGGLYQMFKDDMVPRVAEIKVDVEAGRLSAPTLVMWGYNDPSATLDRCLQPALDLFFPNVSDVELHVLNEAGHYCFREQPDAFVDTLVGFIDRHAGLS